MTALWSSPERRMETCASCAGERPFEQPPSPAGHVPGECPELTCLACGHVLPALLPARARLVPAPRIPQLAAAAV
ncbi:MAG: hypothetical protein K0R62_6612 [Nonomuraea muscovyensis]|nr:hypothetical protein [Nonomuraea muscovyensis]